MKKHIVKIMMLLAVPALAVVSCDSYDRTEVKDTITVDHNKITLFEGEQMQLKASPTTLDYTWSSTNEEIVKVVESENGECTVEAVAEGAANVVAKSGDITFSVECIVQVKVPITGVEFRDGDVHIVTPNGTKTIVINTIPNGGNDIPLTDFGWSIEDENIARISPSGVLKGLEYGITKLHYYRGSKEEGAKYYPLTATVSVSNASPAGSLPRLSDTKSFTKMFKDWDNGGSGVGYLDKSNRDGNDPDVEGAGNIGYTTSGEWLGYTIYVEKSGTYKSTVTGSSSAGKGTFGGEYQWYLNEPNVEGNELGARFKMQSGGAWGGPWMPSETVEFHLDEGLHRIFFYMHNGAHNVYDFTFEWVSAE